ncbi:MAG: RraA family protein [Candidatus Brocadiia bacterium]
MDRQALIEACRGLRVSDVSDALDHLGLMDRCLMDPRVRPLWRDTDTFAHRVAGPALTVRYLPTNREVPNMEGEDFAQYVADWYRDIAPAPFRDDIRAGDVLVMDAADQDVGFVGSNNCLGWVSRGAAAVVTNGGARDTDELIKQRCVVYSRFISRGFKPGRLEFDTAGVPVNCGGVLVRPGDMVVADGDGVVVVPVEKAPRVAEIARRVLEGDKRGRRKLYDQAGLPPDPSVAE